MTIEADGQMSLSTTIMISDDDNDDNITMMK